MKQNLYIFLIILFHLQVTAQNNNFQLFTEILIDSTLDLSDNEKELLANYFFKKINDSSKIYFTEINELDKITDFKNPKELIKTKTDYFKTTKVTSSYKINKDSVSYYTYVPKIDEYGNQVYDKETGNEIFVKKLIKESIKDITASIITYEEWFLKGNKFIKTNKIISLNKQMFDYSYHIIGTESFFNAVIQKKSKYSKHTLFKKEVSYNFYFTNNFSKQSNYFNRCIKSYYTDIYKLKKQLANSLLENIYKNRLSVFDLNNNKLSIEKIDSLFTYKTIDFIYDSTGEIIKNKTEKTYVSYKINDIIGINFTEDWYLAKNQFDIIKEVKSITFIVNDYNEKGEIIGTKKLPCIIKFKN